jgi:hypothetical protein
VPPPDEDPLVAKAFGYLIAMLAWLVGMTLALIYYGMNGSALWAFIVPFGAVGAILYGFGAWADRVGKRGLSSAHAPPRSPPTDRPDQPADRGVQR